MTEPDEDASQVYIWTIACILFVCVVVGGGCFLAYVTVDEYQSSSLLLVLGFAFVCTPWIFWILTVMYRLLSRAFGFRMVLCGLYVNNTAKVSGDDGGGDECKGGDDVIVDVDEKSNENDGKTKDVYDASPDSEKALASSMAS
ncbi:Glucose-inhibited division family A protein isoform 1 [Hibiscus syriacus]|uniref:Glucose-inhibited division family A protein isoform 1 n=1 Tax=Hibiscus syriacus TaxID=106335 RepID=A0A6A2Y1X6_HIBSY|nr:uncharacterized protein LOC120181663 [Hibiscus syriacus]KAE8665749.1 Glucose-inhibited division family A protein isoform 1 [Hibiscus syriacus]